MRTYLSLIPTVQGPSGFISTDRCDSLLLSSLLASVAPGIVDPRSAEDTVHPGRWYRRPVSIPECYSTGESRSTISRDQLLGVLWWAWRTQRLDILQDLWRYGEERSWFMGDGRLDGADTQFGPLVGLLAREIFALGGSDYAARLVPLPAETEQGSVGFDAHLQVLEILLAGEIGGDISDSALERLREQVARQPRNPLYQYAAHRYTDGVQGAATALLSDPALYPSDHLPTSADRCEEYLPQRDDGPDWQPCPAEGRTHSGVDFLFVADLIIRSGEQ